MTAQQAYAAMAEGAVLVDSRPEYQHRSGGEIPGAVLVERNHLEWRCDLDSPSRIEQAHDHEVHWIVICAEGYASSLAAASLQQLGLRPATDVIGGFQAWRAAGLPASGKPRRPVG